MPLSLNQLVDLLPDGSEALRAFDSVAGELEVLGLAQSSKLVKPGYVFCALAGEHTSGLNYLAQAVAEGAIAVLAEASLAGASTDALEQFDIGVYLVPQLRERLGELAAAVYQTHSPGIRLFGVTGTNGKTSTATYLQRLLIAAGTPCGLSASTERSFGGHSQAAELTTPEVTELHWLISEMRATESAASIEVSAQALVRSRVDGLVFDVVGFTNLSRDHLDDFGSMGSYLAAKLELFTPTRARAGVVFLGDDFARAVVERASIPLTTIGADGDWAYEFADSAIHLASERVKLTVPWAASELMARNMALALVMLIQAGFGAASLERAAGAVNPAVSGRLEQVATARVTGFVDYAHTPHAIESALAALDGYPWVTIIFGASGNRDTGKRTAMAEAAARANFTVVTDQHPRNEDPALIRRILSTRLRELEAEFVEIADPIDACAEALSRTPDGGAVIWCGPGQLSYREVAGKKEPFSASAILRDAIENA